MYTFFLILLILSILLLIVGFVNPNSLTVSRIVVTRANSTTFFGTVIVFCLLLMNFTYSNETSNQNLTNVESNIPKINSIVKEAVILEELNLSEAKRRTIFKEIIAAERRANDEATAVYDIYKAGVSIEDIKNHGKLSGKLMIKYKNEVLMKNSITDEEETNIVIEATKKDRPNE